MIRIAIFCPIFLLASLAPALQAQQPEAIKTDQVIVYYDQSMKPAAEQVRDLYPRLKKELESSLGWRLSFRPSVIIVSDSQAFQRIAAADLYVALAVPSQNIILIDFSKVNRRPFSLRAILKHEMCHLLLHYHIRYAHLPKWLDEGVAQWTSDGLSEVMLDKSVLQGAALTNTYISLSRLRTTFPLERRSLFLAYEESKSVVEYVVRRYGRDGLLSILAGLKSGLELEEAVHQSLSISLDELESDWRVNLKKKANWFGFLIANLYEVLFFLAALLAIIGYIKFIIRKKMQIDEEDDY